MQPIVFLRPDGKECPAYVAEPGGEATRAGIVLIHEMWGVTAPIRELAERCVAAGYQVIIPDLFRGKLAQGLEQGFQMMGELDWRDAAEQDVRGAAQWLGRTASKRATLGFCLGGALSILAAMRAPELDAAVCFYGIPSPAAGDPATIRIPLLAHFAALDNWCTPDKVDALERRLQAGAVDVELHRYEAAHAFMNPESDGFSEPMSRLAWQRTLEFLDAKLH
jgi:carboxymethylenebutenolidase